MQDASSPFEFLELLSPFFAWMAEHPAAAILAIVALPLLLTAAVVLFGRPPPALPAEAPPPALPEIGRAHV